MNEIKLLIDSLDFEVAAENIESFINLGEQGISSSCFYNLRSKHIIGDIEQRKLYELKSAEFRKMYVVERLEFLAHHSEDKLVERDKQEVLDFRAREADKKQTSEKVPEDLLRKAIDAFIALHNGSWQNLLQAHKKILVDSGVVGDIQQRNLHDFSSEKARLAYVDDRVMFLNLNGKEALKERDAREVSAAIAKKELEKIKNKGEKMRSQKNEFNPLYTAADFKAADFAARVKMVKECGGTYADACKHFGVSNGIIYRIKKAINGETPQVKSEEVQTQNQVQTQVKNENEPTLFSAEDLK